MQQISWYMSPKTSDTWYPSMDALVAPMSATSLQEAPSTWPLVRCCCVESSSSSSQHSIAPPPPLYDLPSVWSSQVQPLASNISHQRATQVGSSAQHPLAGVVTDITYSAMYKRRIQFFEITHLNTLQKRVKITTSGVNKLVW